jgi:hypothetical protein
VQDVVPLVEFLVSPGIAVADRANPLRERRAAHAMMRSAERQAGFA